jgi:tRNA dimethylallyltransferase
LPTVIVIVGPTASGKTDLCVQLNSEFPIEVINADSRQVYKLMDIGTAKPTKTQILQVPHHLIDIVEPEDEFNVSIFKQLAKSAMQSITSNSHIPVICGGSGQYIKSILDNWTFANTPPDKDLRAYLYEFAKDKGNTQLHEKLKQLDPVRASQIDSRNTHRVIRAIEISSSPISATSMHQPDSYLQENNYFIIGLTMERELLYNRIDTRVDEMLHSGLYDEVQKLLDVGYSHSARCFNSPGYKELIKVIHGELTLQEAVSQIKNRTHKLARKQYNWFKLTDPNINWFDANDTDLLSNVTYFLKSLPDMIH